MGKATSESVLVMRTTGRGSDHYGACDQCGKNCSETHVITRCRVSIRADGLRYLSPVTGGTYGHKECLTRDFGPAVDQATLKRAGNLLIAP